MEIKYCRIGSWVTLWISGFTVAAASHVSFLLQQWLYFALPTSCFALKSSGRQLGGRRRWSWWGASRAFFLFFEVRVCLPGCIETCPLSPASCSLKTCSRFKVLGLSNQASIMFQTETMAQYSTVNGLCKGSILRCPRFYSLPQTIWNALLRLRLQRRTVLLAVFTA